MDPLATTRDLNENKTKRKHRLEGIGEYDLSRQSKNVIANVLKFVKSLNDPTVRETVDFKKSQELTAKLCGVSLSSVQRCVREQKTNPQFSAPRKSYSRAKPQTGLSDSDCDLVRRTVSHFYNRGEIPTAEKVRSVLQEKIGYTGSVASVLRLLRALDLRHKKKNTMPIHSAPSPPTGCESTTNGEPSKMERANQIMKECYDNFKPSLEWDEHSVYGENIASRLRKISNSKRLCILRNKIDNLIFEAELEEYDELALPKPNTNSLTS